MFDLILKVAKPLLGLVISKPEMQGSDPFKAQDSLMAKNWRPWTAGTFAVLLVLSIFTSVELTDATVGAIAAVLIVLAGGRSYEKKAIEKAADAIKKLN